MRRDYEKLENINAKWKLIDLESARSLELVQSQCGQRNISLLGTLDRCSTPMGRKLLRANILQPPCEERVILERQAAVGELVSNRSLRALIQVEILISLIIHFFSRISFQYLNFLILKHYSSLSYDGFMALIDFYFYR